MAEHAKKVVSAVLPEVLSNSEGAASLPEVSSGFQRMSAGAGGARAGEQLGSSSRRWCKQLCEKGVELGGGEWWHMYIGRTWSSYEWLRAFASVLELS